MFKEKDKKYIAGTYSRKDVLIIEGKNSRCVDENGREYIDFTSGIGVNSLGFCDKEWTQAVAQQAGRLAHVSNLYYTQPQIELAEKICQKTGMKKVFFANSGAEANEGAIKTARKYSADKYSSDRFEIITLKNSFHGRTIATLAATGQDVFHKNFSPFPEGFLYAEANNIDDVKSKISEKTCGIMLECIQGEGGVLPIDEGFLVDVDEICKEKDILLIIDEVQTGVGRTGKFVSSQYYKITPDIITLAKGLGGGLPIGAVLFGEKTEKTLGLSDHATTYGGNPVVCAGANVVMDKMNDNLLNDVVEKSSYITNKLLTFPGVSSVEGKGLMLGVSLESGYKNNAIVEECLINGLMVLTAKDKIRLLPPLNISYEDIDDGLKIIKKVLQENEI